MMNRIRFRALFLSPSVTALTFDLTVSSTRASDSYNASRWPILDINGGIFTSTNSVAGVVIGGTNTGQFTMQIRNAALAKVERLEFGQTDLAGHYYLNLSAGSLHIGASGMVPVSTAPGFTAAARPSGGVRGAPADSTSDVPIALTETAVIHCRE